MPHYQAAQSAPTVAQALALTSNNTSYKPSYDDKSGVDFSDVMKDEYKAQQAREQQAREAYADDSRARRENEKIEAREAEKAEERKKADAKDTDNQIKEKESTDHSQDTSATSDTKETETTAENTHVDDSVSVISNPLQQTQLPHHIQKLLQSVDIDIQDNQFLQLTVKSSEFSELSDLQKLQFLSVMNSLHAEDVYNLQEGADLTSLEGFMNKLALQLKQQDPGATLSNLTPQQITNIQNHLAQAGKQASADDLLNSILALQNIDPDTALSRGGPGGVHAGMDRQEIIEGALNDQIINEIASILAGMAQIAAPAAEAQRAQANATASTAVATPTAQNAANNQAQSASVNNLVTGGAADSTLHGGSDPLLSGAEEDGAVPFEKTMNRLGNDTQGYTPQTSNKTDNPPVTTNTAQQATNTPATNAISGLTLPPGLDLNSGVLNIADSILQELGLNGTLVHGSSAQSASLASPVTSSQNAGHAHPATQVVAATLHKSASDGVSKALTLRLDPPELGRVEIKMSFEKNSQIKAVLTIENPETHLMMQRDAQTLERALQDAGFDAQGSLSFELAQDGHDFEQDGSHDNFHQGRNGETITEEDVDVIETTMNWSVDAQTGHVSYNLLV